jgi:hypothetical protein
MADEAPGSEASRRHALRDLLVAAGVAIATVVAGDLALGQISPPYYVREIVDATAEYEREDPTVLVMGSSHARTFEVADRMARERTGDKTRIMSVPLEFGKFTSYEWVYENRLEPLMDARTKDGALARPSLGHFVMVTAWWDGCALDTDPPEFNLPSRAWTASHFFESVLEGGITEYNRNYVTARFLEHTRGSILTSDRGYGRLLEATRRRFVPLSPEAATKRQAMLLRNWQGILERGAECLGHPEELAALDRVIVDAKQRGYDVTLMLYPMMPITVTEISRTKVLEPFSVMMRDAAMKHEIRFIDATSGIMVDEDFMPDFDHLTPAGHRKLTEWLFSGPMRFLVDGREGGHS